MKTATVNGKEIEYSPDNPNGREVAEFIENAAAKLTSLTTATANLSGTNTGDVTLGNVGSTPAATGASISGQVLTLQPASDTQPGVLTAGDQDIGVGSADHAAKTIKGSGNHTGLEILNTGSGGSGVGLYMTKTGAGEGAGILTIKQTDGTNVFHKYTLDFSNIEIMATSGALILKSPDGTRYALRIANGGTVAITPA